VTATPELARARDSLLRYYQQWQTLTEAESDAIRSGNWLQVQRLQASKQQLQECIGAATETLRAEAESSGADRSEIENEFHGMVDHLIHLESRNREAVATRWQQTKADLAELESSRHNLRQVQRAYSPARAAVWQSYS
jgi:hypothetical protein